VGRRPRRVGPGLVRDAAVSFFNPLFSGPASYPPIGSNFGFYNNPSVTSLIAKGASSASASSAATIWAQADEAVMKDAPFYPIVDPKPAAVPRQLRAQRGVHPGDPAVRPDEHLDEFAGMIPDSNIS